MAEPQDYERYLGVKRDGTDHPFQAGFLNQQHMKRLQNKSGGSVTTGDVAILDSSNDTAFTTTTTQGYSGVVGVVPYEVDIVASAEAQVALTIASNDWGEIQFTGVVDKVTCDSAASRGNYLLTDGVAKQATPSTTSLGEVPPEGTFAVALTAGTTPKAFLLGATVAGGENPADPDNYQGKNLVKNFPSRELADGAQPEWWEEQDANVTLTEEDAAGESIPEKHLRVLKIVSGAAGANKYVYQRFTFADEDLLDAGQTAVSASVWVYQATTGDTLKLDLVGDNSGSLGSDTTTAIGAWTRLEVRNKTIGASDTYVDIRISTGSNSDTFYATMPVLNVGPRPIPWQERPMRFVEKVATLVDNADPTTTDWTDVDCTSNTHALAFMVALHCSSDTSAGTYSVYCRRNGSSESQGGGNQVSLGSTGDSYWDGFPLVMLDDGNIYEYSAEHANVNAVYQYLRGYWRWA